MFVNVFESSNARDIEQQVLANEFIWTPAFDRLLTKRNHIMLGARGTGKTAFAKMLSFPAICKCSDPRAKVICDSFSFIGMYLPLRAEFTTKLKSVANNNILRESYFLWSMNLASCSSLVSTLKDFILKRFKDLITRVKKENEISIILGRIFFNQNVASFDEIIFLFSKLEFEKNHTFNKAMFGIALNDSDFELGRNFHSELFSSLRVAIKEIKPVLQISENTTWALCIDEAEILEDWQWVLLNTHMRTYSDIFLKITTMPYKHKTLETQTEEPLNPKHDFEYIYLDRLGTSDRSQVESDKIVLEFASKLFRNKVSSSQLRDSGITLENLLGESYIEFSNTDESDVEFLISMIYQYCNDATKNRALYLFRTGNRAKFSDEILRKLKPLLVIKDYFANTTGQAFSSPRVYSGFDVVVRCCDGNPRKLINIFNRLIAVSLEKKSYDTLDDTQQGRIVRSFSTSEIEAIKADESGYRTFAFLYMIGSYFKKALHVGEIGTEIPMAFDYDLNNESLWESIKFAVDLGLLIPGVTQSDGNDRLPIRSGIFHLASCLAPYFSLPPRKGTTLKLSTILRRATGESSLKGYSNEFEKQLGLFDE